MTHGDAAVTCDDTVVSCDDTVVSCDDTVVSCDDTVVQWLERWTLSQVYWAQILLLPFKAWAIYFIPHCFSSLSYIHDLANVAIDSNGYKRMSALRVVIVAWLNASKKS